MPVTIGGATPTQAQSLALALAFGHPYILAQSAVPRILLSSATNITTAGLITGLTALPYTPSGVVIVYCFAQAGLVAGLYYARFSSTTSCQLYSDAAGTVVLSGITAGAYAGGTTEVTLATVTVPGGAMGANGSLRFANNIGFTAPNTAGAKTSKIQLGGTSLQNAAYTTLTALRQQVWLRNRGRSDVQLAYNPGLTIAYVEGTSATAVVVQTAIDTSIAQDVTFRAICAVVTDYIILEGYTIEVLPGA